MTSKHTSSEQKTSYHEDEVDIALAIAVLRQRKRLFLIIPSIFVALAVIVSLLMPNVYMSSTKLLPPQQQQSGAAALLSQLGSISSVTSAVGLKNSGDLFIGMLKSRTVADNLIAQFDLKKRYETDSQEKARKELLENTTITEGKDGLITIAVEDKDQQLVAKLANAYTQQLMNLTKVLAVTQSAQRRLFYEQQLSTAKDNLAQAELNLKSKIAESGIVNVTGESRAIVETVSRMRAQISAKEIQLRAMGAYLTSQNPEYKRVEQELASTKIELARLENGVNGTTALNSKGNSSGMESTRLLRDVKYYETLYEMLAKQYEVARLDEANEPTVIQVLDSAVTPEKKYKPRRTLIVIGAGIFGVFAAFIYVLFLEMVSRVRAIAAHAESLEARRIKPSMQ